MSEEVRDIQTTPDSKNETSSYRSIFKATSLFGGVQLYQILIEVVKSKIIAVLLGPLGVGISGLYTSATNLVQNFTSFGLASSAVKNVAEANSTGDSRQIAKVIFSLKRLAWLTGVLGMIIVILASPLLSQTSFGDNEHVIPFMVISVTLLFAQLNAGQRVTLQGTRRLKDLAKSSAIGVTCGFVIAVPLYYWLGLNGIVPNIVIASATSLIITWYFSRRIEIEKTTLNIREVFSVGKSMLIMGVAMSLNTVLTSISSFVLLACIRLWGGVEMVGLFTAGFTLMTQYTGLVFNAMGTDYYPRLAAINQDNGRCSQIMNQQGIVGLLIIAPLLVLCIVFIPFVVRILYSDSFVPVNGYIIWCSLGMMFKIISWSISYVFVAKAESKLFMFNEFVAAIYTLLLNLIGFKFGGLTGLGVSFAISYILYLFQVYIIAKRKYGFCFDKQLLLIFIYQLILVLFSVVVVFVISSYWKYIIGSIILLLSVGYSLKELNKRLDLLSLFKKR